jgi:dTMP kinase
VSRSPETPRFIVLEGADGSGKSTQVTRLVERLRGSGRTVVETFEPGATALGARIRAIVLDGPDASAGGTNPAAITEALLMAADRAQHVAEVIRPALSRGDWVVCDRFVPSSLVYQGSARGLGVDVVATASAWATDGIEPDLIIVLDVDDAVADARRSQSDRLEREGNHFHAAVRAAYRDLARSRGWAVVDANADVDAVADQVWSIVSEVGGV